MERLLTSTNVGVEHSHLNSVVSLPSNNQKENAMKRMILTSVKTMALAAALLLSATSLTWAAGWQMLPGSSGVVANDTDPEKWRDTAWLSSKYMNINGKLKMYIRNGNGPVYITYSVPAPYRAKVQHIPINLEMIMQGTAPDMFLKPGDIINVGSHPTAQWIAVIRSSFRTTYGFGFVYDRNFADVDFGR